MPDWVPPSEREGGEWSPAIVKPCEGSDIVQVTALTVGLAFALYRDRQRRVEGGEAYPLAHLGQLRGQVARAGMLLGGLVVEVNRMLAEIDGALDLAEAPPQRSA